MIGWCESVFQDGISVPRRFYFIIIIIIRITNNLLENLGETKKRFDLHSGTSGIGEAILDFIEWFHSKEFGKK